MCILIRGLPFDLVEVEDVGTVKEGNEISNIDVGVRPESADAVGEPSKCMPDAHVKVVAGGYSNQKVGHVAPTLWTGDLRVNFVADPLDIWPRMATIRSISDLEATYAQRSYG